MKQPAAQGAHDGQVLDGYYPLGSESRVFVSYAAVFLAGVVLLWQKSRWSKSLLLRALAFVGATVVIYNIAVVAMLAAYAVWFAGVTVLSRLAPSGLAHPVGETLFFGLWLLPYLVGVHAVPGGSR